MFSAANPVMCSRAVVGTISTGIPSATAGWLVLVSVVIRSPCPLLVCRTFLIVAAPIPSSRFWLSDHRVKPPLGSDATSVGRVVGDGAGGDPPA